MNQGQEQFFNFILERVQNGKQEEAKALLAESFEKQSNNTFDADYLTGFIPRMTALLKAEHIEEVSKIMTGYNGPRGSH
ncbi:MAG: hypothetical protein K0R05_1443 [Anaerocolumna sp.]|jgi:hypothetical protein|nr:hypothetical protein [Anaerocolumna sp.]